MTAIESGAAAAWQLTLVNSVGETLQFTASEGHPFYVDGRGWVDVKDVKVGDIIVAQNGSVFTLQEKAFVEQVVTWSLAVAENHTFFVGDGLGNEVLVHNGGTFDSEKSKRLVKEMYVVLDAVLYENGISDCEAERMRGILTDFINKAKSTRSSLIQGCWQWVFEVGDVNCPGIMMTGGRTWDYYYSLYTTGWFSDSYVAGHAAIELKIGHRIFLLDNGWWGPVFTLQDVPFTVRPQQVPSGSPSSYIPPAPPANSNGIIERTGRSMNRLHGMGIGPKF